MDGGRGPRRRARRLVGLAVASSLLVLGCSLLQGLGGPRPLAFSHQMHVGEEELECEACHETAWVEEDPGMPALDACAACHSVIDAERPADRRVDVLFEGEQFVAAHVSALPEEVVFSHQTHVSAGLECSECHEAVETGDRVRPDQALGMADCIACHATRDQGQECRDCHTLLDRDTAPESHHQGWIRSHGWVARSGSEAVADDCSLCHAEPFCVTCHAAMAPESHTNYFRLRGHGLVARMDRSVCASCHRSDSCDRCHEQATPANHHGPWGGTQSTHCLYCHLPLAGEGCAACHRDTPSHDMAPPKPPDHNPAMNCRQCHGLSAPLPHVDNGSECNFCHH